MANITQNDIYNLLKNKVQIFGPSSVLEDGGVMPFNEQLAIISHYLQNKSSMENLSYKDKAQELIEDLIKDDVINSQNKACELAVGYSLFDFAKFEPISKPKCTFIDLFAGIGGFRIAMQNNGGKCVFSSEWDENAQKTYYYNFGEVPFGDITLKRTKSYIPDNFDVLCAGFPCQAFSVAGYRRGFEDARGTLFFDVAEIIKTKRPKAVFLENVKNLCTHDNGKTFSVIKGTLEELGYVIYYKVMNAMDYANIPQNRERIFIICFDPNQVPNYKDFEFPDKVSLTNTIQSCIDYTIDDEKYYYTEKMSHFQELKESIVSRDTIYQWRRQYVRENKSQVCPTLTANMGTGGHNVPLILTDEGIRKLSPKECLNFQGFPEDYSFPEIISQSAKYKQAGNSVVVPLIQKVCKNLVSIICQNS